MAILHLAFRKVVSWSGGTYPTFTHSFTAERPVFVHRLRLMSQYPHRLLVVTTALSRIKSRQPHGGGNPNRLTQSLDRCPRRFADSFPMYGDS